MAAKNETTITLKAPDDDLIGKGITALTMRPPRAKDKFNSINLSKTEADAEALLFATLCDVGVDVIGNLELVDYNQVADAFLDFQEGKHLSLTKASGR